MIYHLFWHLKVHLLRGENWRTPSNTPYDLYKEWFSQFSPRGIVQGRNAFKAELLVEIQNHPDWKYDRKRNPVTIGNRMTVPEPLILQYNLTKWMNPIYKGNDPNQICMPSQKHMDRGLERKVPTITVTIGTQSIGYDPAADKEKRY